MLKEINKRYEISFSHGRQEGGKSANYSNMISVILVMNGCLVEGPLQQKE